MIILKMFWLLQGHQSLYLKSPEVFHLCCSEHLRGKSEQPGMECHGGGGAAGARQASALFSGPSLPT